MSSGLISGPMDSMIISEKLAAAAGMAKKLRLLPERLLEPN